MRKGVIVSLLVSALWSGAWAQTDVTSTYVTRADFSSIDAWTQNHSSTTFWALGNGLIGTYAVANDKKSTTDDTHLSSEYCLGIQCRWSTNYAHFTQDLVDLPAGVYTLTYDVQNKNSSTSATYDNRFYVQVGSNKTTDSSTEWMRGSSDWTTHTISFTLGETSNVTISFGYGTGNNNFASGSTPHLYVSHLKLMYEDLLAGLKGQLASAQATATGLLGNSDYNNVTGAVRTTLQTLSTATAASETVEAYETLIEQVNDAIDAFKAAKPLADNTAAVAGATKDNPVETNFVVNGTFDSGISPWQRTGTFQNNKTANNQYGDFTGNFYENWNGSAQENKMYQVINNIPNGTYKLKIAAFVNNFVDEPNESQFVFANADKTYLTTGTPTFYEVYTYVTGNTIEIGLEQTTATANWMGIDNVSLTYYGADNVVEELTANADKIAWQEALSAAQEALTTYAGVVDPTKEALETEVGKSEPTTNEAYQAAAAALRTATTNFLTAAEAYNANKADLEDEIAYAGSIGVATTDAETVLNAATSTGADFLAATEALKVLEYNTFAGEGTEYTVDVTTTYVKPSGWEGNIGTISGQHWNGGSDSYMDKWNGSAATFSNTQTVSLPAGDYVFMTPGRGVKGILVTMTVGETTVSYPTKGDVGYGIDIDGKANFSPEGTYANNNQGRGWEWRYVPVTLTEAGDVTVTLTLELKANTWGSFTDLVILAKPSANLVLDELKVAIDEANDIANAVDVNAVAAGDVFQVTSSAVKALNQAIHIAQDVYDAAEGKTMEEVEQATTDMREAIEAFNNSELVAPESDHLYNLVLTDEGFNYVGKPITFKKGNANSGGYAIGYSDNPGSPYNQDILFEAAEGVNCYYMYIKDAANNQHYVGTGSNYTGGNDYQLRMTDIKENALVLKAERKYNVLSFINTKTNSYVGSNGDAGFYTSDNNHKFEIRDFVPTEFTLKVADGKYGTVIFPSFPVSDLYSGLKFYTCEEVDGTELVLNEVAIENLEIDKPYIIQNVGGVDMDITTNILGRAYSTELTFGLLTGLYSSGTGIPAGKYVLQTKDGVQSFRKVPEGGMTGTKFRAYLTYDGGGEVNALGFQADETTAIHGIDALLNGEGAEAIYTADGARIAAPQKGLNIIKMSNGKTVKVLIK